MIDEIEKPRRRFPAVVAARRCLTAFPVAIVLAACCGLIAASLTRIVRQSLLPFPIDPWEAATISVAARVANGEPMYRLMNEPSGIEPGLYSPLQPLTLAAVFSFTGANLAAPRVINLAAGVLFVAIFLRALRLHRDWPHLLFGVAVLLMLDRQMTGLWDLPRADAVPLLCGLLYACAAYRACLENRLAWAAAAHVALVVGLLWKQTIVAIAPAVFFAALVTPNCSRRMRLVFFFCPAAVILATAGLIAWLSPNLFETMFRLGGRYAIQFRTVALYAYALLLFTPLLWMGVWFALFRGPSIAADTKFRWALAFALTAVPLDFLASGKVGGGPNSLAHLLYAWGAATLCIAPELFRCLRSDQMAVSSRCVLGIAVSLALVIEWTSVFTTPSRVKLHRPFGDSGRQLVIDFARKLPGKVVSPQDPTLSLEAKNYAGASVANEWDRHLWKWPLPKVIQEMQSADYVITWGKTNTWQTWSFDEGMQLLPEMGFQRLTVPGLTNSEYSVWKHVR